MEKLLRLAYTAYRRIAVMTLIKLKTQKETDIWVGARIRVRRLELRLSQTEVGNHLGITFQQVQKYEKGATRIGAGRLLALAHILAVPVSYFFPEAAPNVLDQSANQIEVLDLIHTQDAVKLLRDFARITDPVLRRCVVNLLTFLANTHNQDDDVLSHISELP